MPFDEKTRKICEEKCDVLAEGLLNCSYFETQPQIREEAMKSTVALIESLGKYLEKYVPVFQESAWFHLSDQASLVKLYSA